MTGEEMERAIEFLLKSQAQLTANVGKLSDTVDTLSATVDTLSTTMDKLSTTVDTLSTKVDRTADSVTALLAIAEIHEREITATDEKLNALIGVVERLVENRGTE